MMRYLLLVLSMVVLGCNASKDVKPVNNKAGDIVVKEVVQTIFIGDSLHNYGNERVFDGDYSNREELRLFATELIEQVRQGKLSIKSPVLHEPMSTADFEAIWNRNDTISLEMPDGKVRNLGVESPYEPQDITHLRFKEEWRFNAHSQELTKKVKEVALIIANFAPNGEYRGKTPLFWIQLPQEGLQ